MYQWFEQFYIGVV